MKITRFGVSLIALLLSCQILFAQQKRPLTHADYDGWESLGSQKISKNGQWVGFQVIPQDGDGRLEIFSFKDPSKRQLIPRGQSYLFTPDDKFAVGKIGVEKDSVYALKLKKTKKDDMPADSLFIYSLADNTFYGAIRA